MKNGGTFVLLRHPLRNLPVLFLRQRLDQVSGDGVEQKLFSISAGCYNPDIRGR